MYTVLVPREEANFTEEQSAALTSALDGHPSKLTFLLSYHVIPGRLWSSNVTDGLTKTTLNGQNVTFGVDGDAVTVNGLAVTKADIPASNGIIHVIESLLVPEMKNIVEAADDLHLNTLLSLAGQFPDIVKALSETENITLFAPTDEAFAKLPKETLDNLLNDPDALRSVLLYHVSPELIFTSQLEKEETSFPTLGGEVIRVNKYPMKMPPMMRHMMPLMPGGPHMQLPSMVFVNGIQLCGCDLEASNGLIHTIDSVLIPPTENMLEIVSSDPDLSTLTTAVKKAGLASAFDGEGPLTLFAPTNAAFDLLPEGALDALLEDPDKLADILKGHATSMVLYHNGMKGKAVETLANTKVETWNKNPRFGTFVFVNKDDPAMIVKPDITATNGVVHKIDKVLVPM